MPEVKHRFFLPLREMVKATNYKVFDIVESTHCILQTLNINILRRVGVRLVVQCFYHFVYFSFFISETDTENLIKYLISKGADVNTRDSFEETPLFLCARLGK